MATKRKPLESTESTAPTFRVLPDPAPSVAGKISLGAFVKKTAEKKSVHPYITSPSEEFLETLALFAQEKPKLKALEGTVKALSGQAGMLGKPFWFGHWHGRGDAGSTMLVNVGGKDVKLVFKNAYSSQLTDDAPLIELLGPGASHFKQATELKIKLDDIPEELQQPFVNAILEKAAELGITSGIEAKQFIKPGPGIHEQRHTLFTPEQNLAIDQILPITAYPQI